MSLFATGAILGASALGSLLSKGKTSQGNGGLGSQLGDLAVQGAGQFVGGSINEYFQKRAQERGTQASKELMREQQIAQNQNNLNAGLMMRSSKERAGFNVNADGSISPSLTPPSAIQSGIPTDTNGMSLLPMSQVALNEAQARDLNATAGLKERKLKGETEADKVYSSGDFSVKCIRTDKFIEVEVFNEKREPVTTREGFLAVKDVANWLRRDWNQLKLDEMQLAFKKNVAEQQLGDVEVLNAVANMPTEEFNNLVQDTAVKKALEAVYIEDKQLRIDEHDLNVLRKSSEENSSVGVLLDKLSHQWDEKDLLGALGTLVKLLFVSALTTVSGNVSFSKGSSKSTVNSTSHSTSHSTVNSKSNSTSHVHTYKH